jgi:ABC-type phosphate/phosphonate transport system substrate-binding protein
LQALGCSVFAGSHENIDLSALEGQLDIAGMSAAALNAVDMDGANRVCRELMTLADRS